MQCHVRYNATSTDKRAAAIYSNPYYRPTGRNKKRNPGTNNEVAQRRTAANDLSAPALQCSIKRTPARERQRPARTNSQTARNRAREQRRNAATNNRRAQHSAASAGAQYSSDNGVTDCATGTHIKRAAGCNRRALRHTVRSNGLDTAAGKGRTDHLATSADGQNAISRCGAENAAGPHTNCDCSTYGQEHDRVRAGTQVDHVGWPVAHRDSVGAVPQGDRVGTIADGNGVVAITAGDCVVAIGRGDGDVA